LGALSLSSSAGAETEFRSNAQGSISSARLHAQKRGVVLAGELLMSIDQKNRQIIGNSCQKMTIIILKIHIITVIE
jgi:hypothetical protein